jgi:hypothetical protein
VRIFYVTVGDLHFDGKRLISHYSMKAGLYFYGFEFLERPAPPDCGANLAARKAPLRSSAGYPYDLLLQPEIIRMPVAEWIAVENSPRQRDTDRHLRRTILSCGPIVGRRADQARRPFAGEEVAARSEHGAERRSDGRCLLG